MEILNGIIFFGLFIIILFYIKYTWNQTKYLEVKKEDFLDQPKLKYGFLPSNYAENSEYHLNPPIIKVKESNNDNNDNDNDNDNEVSDYAMSYLSLQYPNQNLNTELPYQYASDARYKNPPEDWVCQRPWLECNYQNMPHYWH